MNKNCRGPLCDNTALSLSDYCWAHTEDKKAYISLLEKYNKEGGSMEGFYLKGFNAPSINLLRANLKNANLARVSLEKADLAGCTLANAELAGADLKGCDLAGADCTNANFLLGNLSGARFWHADMTGANFSEANLQDADFLNSILYQSNLYNSNLTNVLHLSKDNFRGPRRRESVSEKGCISARSSYANLKKYFMITASYNDLSWASFNENRMEQRRLLEEKRPGFIPFALMGLLCGWGEKPLRAIGSAIAIVALFSCIFYAFRAITPAFGNNYTPAFIDYFYYSLVTFTTVGCGDFLIRANSAYRLLSGAEAFIGIFMMGLFVFTLGRRYAAR